MSVCASVCICVYRSVCLSVRLLNAGLEVYNMSVHLFVRVFVSLSVCLFIGPSEYLCVACNQKHSKICDAMQ